MTSKYIPFLKFKKNEIYALDYLDKALKAEGIDVFFDLPNELPSKSRNAGIDSFSPEELIAFKTDALTRKIVAQKGYLKSKINFLNDLFVDNYDIDPLVKIDGKEYNYQTIIDELSPFGMIPVCGIDDRIPEHLECILRSAQKGKFVKSKVAIRLTNSVIEDYDYNEFEFESCVDRLANHFREIILIFDLRVISDIEDCKKNLKDFINKIDVKKFSRLIITGSTIPKIITELVETKNNVTVERNEVLIFKYLKDEGISFDYGDYTCVRPETSVLDIYIEEIQSYMTGKIFYPYDNQLYVTRSGKTKGVITPFKPLLDEIVSKPFYRGKSYSFGDKYIFDKQPTGLKVNASSILNPNINLHMTFMLRDFSI